MTEYENYMRTRAARKAYRRVKNKCSKRLYVSVGSYYNTLKEDAENYGLSLSEMLVGSYIAMKEEVEA